MSYEKNIEERFQDILENEEFYQIPVMYDVDFVSDGSTAILRELLPNLEPLLKEKGHHLEKAEICEALASKGECIGNFEIKDEYSGCIYCKQFDSILIPLEETKTHTVDNRWVEAVDNQFEINEVKVYPKTTGKDSGFVLEFIGWKNKDDFYAGKGERILGYVMSCLKRKEG